MCTFKQVFLVPARTKHTSMGQVFFAPTARETIGLFFVGFTLHLFRTGLHQQYFPAFYAGLWVGLGKASDFAHRFAHPEAVLPACYASNP
jgi:hypothetical protein